MHCTWIKDGNGAVAILCGSRPRAKRCACGQPSTLLCDWPIGGGKTCDRPMCASCATEVGPDKHLCAGHRNNYDALAAARAST
jgi:hypothetical protein